MYYANQFLRQLEIANKLAKSRLPQDRRLAVILLDNVLEVDLRRKADHELFVDRSSWHTQRTHKKKERTEIERFFDHLLKFSIRKGFITELQKSQIAFCHTVRNLLFHGDSSESLLIEATLLIQFNLIARDPERWGKTTGYAHAYQVRGKKSVVSPGYENRYFPKEGRPLLDLRPHWSDAIRRTLTFGLKKKSSPSNLLSRSALVFLKKVERNLRDLDKGIDQCDVNQVFFFDEVAGELHVREINKAPKRDRILMVLAYFSCLRKHQEDLADMERTKRTQDFRDRYEAYIHTRPKYPIVALKKAFTSARKISAMETTDALIAYQSLRASFEELANAASDASGRLSDYWEHLYELRYK